MIELVEITPSADRAGASAASTRVEITTPADRPDPPIEPLSADRAGASAASTRVEITSHPETSREHRRAQ
ncbi:hypothetical protein A5785_21235 [Gordonia sp. 852002-50395_SCH5434458]|nr:hypothetical protein A5785_21235 [Gordonia sp. 852002-50395_SCH5434458]